MRLLAPAWMGSLALLSTVAAQNPVCYVCGDATAKVLNPDLIITLPPGSPLPTAGCGQIEGAGLAGLITAEQCAGLQLLKEQQTLCGCSNLVGAPGAPGAAPVAAPTMAPLVKKTAVPASPVEPPFERLTVPPVEPPLETEPPILDKETEPPLTETEPPLPSDAPSLLPSDVPSAVPIATPVDNTESPVVEVTLPPTVDETEPPEPGTEPPVDEDEECPGKAKSKKDKKEKSSKGDGKGKKGKEDKSKGSKGDKKKKGKSKKECKKGKKSKGSGKGESERRLLRQMA
jgi:hypothetical protein